MARFQIEHRKKRFKTTADKHWTPFGDCKMGERVVFLKINFLELISLFGLFVQVVDELSSSRDDSFHLWPPAPAPACELHNTSKDSSPSLPPPQQFYKRCTQLPLCHIFSAFTIIFIAFARNNSFHLWQHNTSKGSSTTILQSLIPEVNLNE